MCVARAWTLHFLDFALSRGGCHTTLPGPLMPAGVKPRQFTRIACSCKWEAHTNFWEVSVSPFEGVRGRNVDLPPSREHSRSYDDPSTHTTVYILSTVDIISAKRKSSTMFQQTVSRAC
ncbi:hypothetical protein OH77DRAFT_1029233 [Trametes cingulata]|nr:hypothetical protein OH77DRAFT_1029233 [Trametes cingulata]